VKPHGFVVYDRVDAEAARPVATHLPQVYHRLNESGGDGRFTDCAFGAPISTMRPHVFLHRAALTVTRHEPYAEWANRRSDDDPDPVPYRDDLPRTVYLVPSIDSSVTLEGLLEDFWPDIFEEELAAWSEDEESWPAPRTRELFDRWFTVELTDTVVDLSPDEPLTSAEAEDAALTDVLTHCAWCDLELEPDEGRGVALEIADRAPLASREGLTLVLSVDDERALSGILTARDSPAALEGEDLIFRACTSRCEKLIRKEARIALRRLLRNPPVQ
jgi:hypothetical protein